MLGRGDLERLLPVADLVEAMTELFRRRATRGVEAPPRTSLPADGHGVLLLMPAGLRDGPGSLGAKLVSVFPGNRARGEPTLYATYVLLDGASGRPLALMEGTTLTGLRTGATSALAARLLARPDASRVVCFGTGAQAACQLVALAAVRRLRHVAVVGRDPQRARAFAETMRARLGVPVELAPDPRAAVRAADLVTCATTSPSPVLFGADLQPGTHVDLVGAFRPSEREADTEAIRRARAVVDTYEGAFAEAGDLLIPLREGAIDRGHVVAELAEVVTGVRAGRTGPEDITLFKSVGWAPEDLAAARLAWERAQALGLGREVSLD